MTATSTSGTVEHDDYPGRLLMEARAEIERLRLRIATLVEALREHSCPADYRYTIAGCVAAKNCGCTDGLLVSGHKTKNASDHS